MTQIAGPFPQHFFLGGKFGLSLLPEDEPAVERRRSEKNGAEICVICG
jgi:hypothetical protein